MKSDDSISNSNGLEILDFGENILVRRANIRKARAIRAKRNRTRRLVKSLVNRILQVLIFAGLIALTVEEFHSPIEDRVGEMILLPIIWFFCIMHDIDLIQIVVDLKDEFIRSMDEDYGINLRRK